MGKPELSSNYDPSKLTTVIMTGVTALVRATAYTMELKSVTYPGERIRDLMREADIAHISNEIPFFTGCTVPKPDQGALVFCSDPKYIDLLTDIGADVIELTGNHFADRGSARNAGDDRDLQEKGLPLFWRRPGSAGFTQACAVRSQWQQDRIHRLQQAGCRAVPDCDRFPARRGAV
jgi:hypothetical protein